MKITRYIIFNLIASMFLFPNIGSAQILEQMKDFYRDRIIKAGLNPDNQIQLLNCIDTESVYIKGTIVSYWGGDHNLAAIPKMKSMLLSFTEFNLPVGLEYFAKARSTRAILLTSLVAVGDSTIQYELRGAIDTLKSDARNNWCTLYYAKYLWEKFSDDYGWSAVKSCFTPRSDGSMELINFSSLICFYNSTHKDSVVELCRLIAIQGSSDISRFNSINSLVKLNDTSAIDAIENIAKYDTTETSSIAIYALKMLSKYRFNIFTRYALQNNSKKDSEFYNAVIESSQPDLYKMLVDAKLTLRFPNDTNKINNALYSTCLFSSNNQTIAVRLDTLLSALLTFKKAGWIGPDSFINELQNKITSAIGNINAHDSLAAFNDLELFLKKTDLVFRDSIAQVPSFLNFWAWNFLYPTGTYIQGTIINHKKTYNLRSSSPNHINMSSHTRNISLNGDCFNSNTYAFVNEHFTDFSIDSDTTINVTIPDEYFGKPQVLIISPGNIYANYSPEFVKLTIKPAMNTLTPAITFPGVGGFSIDVAGKGFTPNSKILWNGSQRTTAFVADSLLRGTVLPQDVAAVGVYKVNVLTGDSLDILSDSLLFKVVNKLPKPIHVLSDKVVDNLNNTFKACFGYNNLNTESVYIPVGTKNNFSPDPVNRQQTTVFLPGRQKYAFCTTIDVGDNITWNLNGRKVKVKTQCDYKKKIK